MAVHTAAYSSAVGQIQNYDDDVYNSTESRSSGIFAMPHCNNNKKSSKKCTTKSERGNMFTSAQTFIIVAATFVGLLQQCLAISATETAETTTSLTTAKPTALSTVTSVSVSGSISPDEYRECGSMDIRNRCENFKDLEGCTVIRGYLLLVLIQAKDVCNYSNYHFPKLREITDFILIHEIKMLTSFKTIFPNLTVIRGQRLFLNYAIGITRMPGMTALELPSLVAIQRGHVFISENPVLCSLNTINFDRLTLSVGENHITPVNQTACPKTDKYCQGCDSGYCWSNKVCQRFENDNILNFQQGIQQCDAQCLGGCNNRTSQGCAVCRTWTDHGVCVDKCPEDKYSSEHYLRCYTREECIAKRMIIYKKECVSFCPGGYRLNNVTRECDSCGGINDCRRLCNPQDPRDPFTIHTLSDIEPLRGCQILNGSVIVQLSFRIDYQELIDNLKDVDEIIGHLKVYDSPHLTSLSFFENLEKIHGQPLEHDHYAFILHNNAKLEDIWTLRKSLELVNGGMYIYLNNRLCNRVILKFKNNVKHDFSLDSIQISDQEVLCSPEKLILGVEVISHNFFKLFWSKDKTTDEVEILYQPVADDKTPLLEKIAVDIPICKRINWQRKLLFAKDLSQNDTHYFYTVDNLEPHTRYRCMVKTFGKEESHEARSDMKIVATQPDVPGPPLVKIYKKSFDSLSVQWYYENREDELVDFYRLEVYEIPDKKEIIDQRDYCEDSVKLYPDNHNEDYDDCCTRRQEERTDALFMSQLNKEFACTLDHKEYCERYSLEDNNSNALLTKRLEHRENNYTIRSLERYHAYALQIQACNHAGCGSFNVITDRTNYSVAADKMYDLTACKMTDNNEYRVHFKEPKKPNGLIITYALHFRYFDSTQGPYLNHMRCVTRLEHERNNYLYVGHLNGSMNQIAVRVESLGHRLFTDWMDITKCEDAKALATTVPDDNSGTGVNVFLVFFLVGCAGGISWICYKRRCWRSLPQLRRYMRLEMSWSNMLAMEPERIDDRQVLVDDYATVHFQNTREDDSVHTG